MEWLVRSVPGIGRGLSAGLMEYPWWFGTETYSLQALAATDDFDLAKDDLRLLSTQSIKANGNGRIVHEVTTNGGVVNHGNTQETAQFIMTVGKVVDWSGDMRFAREMYPAMTHGIDWLLTDMDQNRDLFPEGYGITEILGLNSEVIDVAVYTQQALEATAHISTAWENVSVENLPVGTNRISFSRAKSARGIEYGIDAKEGGWNFVLRIAEVPGRDTT
jgi:hypothetical protein